MRVWVRYARWGFVHEQNAMRALHTSSGELYIDIICILYLFMYVYIIYENQYIQTYKNTNIHYITLHYITLHYITFHYITLHCIALHCIALHCITLHYTTLQYITCTLHYTTLHYIT